MTRVWYCANCGYEVPARGRCHACRAKLVPSALAELETGPDDDEVAYRIDGWSDRLRGQLIVRLNDLGVEHRFEEEELIIDASDEERVDELVAMLGETVDEGSAVAGEPAGPPPSDADAWAAMADPDDYELPGEESGSSFEGSEEEEDEDFAASVRLLADAATRLRLDPTDMQADADVAEASAVVFSADRYGPFDEQEWSAIGRVTRRLLAALGAEDALEDEIRREAGALEKLMAPLVATPGSGPAVETPQAAPGERTVYELADWLPDQRASLAFLLEEAGIAYDWEDDELLVPSDREDEVEALFDRVGGGGADEGDEEAQYQAVAELFAACGRLAGDPTDPARQDVALQWIEASEGPPLLGMDEVDWFRIRTRAKALAAAIEVGEDPDEVYEHASRLQNLLRSVV